VSALCYIVVIHCAGVSNCPKCNGGKIKFRFPTRLDEALDVIAKNDFACSCSCGARLCAACFDELNTSLSTAAPPHTCKLQTAFGIAFSVELCRQFNSDTGLGRAWRQKPRRVPPQELPTATSQSESGTAAVQEVTSTTQQTGDATNDIRDAELAAVIAESQVQSEKGIAILAGQGLDTSVSSSPTGATAGAGVSIDSTSVATNQLAIPLPSETLVDSSTETTTASVPIIAVSQRAEPAVVEPSKVWSCSVCTYINDPTKAACEMCATSRDPSVQMTSLPPAPSTVVSAVEASPFACTVCTYVNAEGATNCSMCATELKAARSAGMDAILAEQFKEWGQSAVDEGAALEKIENEEQSPEEHQDENVAYETESTGSDASDWEASDIVPTSVSTTVAALKSPAKPTAPHYDDQDDGEYNSGDDGYDEEQEEEYDDDYDGGDGPSGGAGGTGYAGGHKDEKVFAQAMKSRKQFLSRRDAALQKVLDQLCALLSQDSTKTAAASNVSGLYLQLLLGVGFGDGLLLCPPRKASAGSGHVSHTGAYTSKASPSKQHVKKQLPVSSPFGVVSAAAGKEPDTTADATEIAVKFGVGDGVTGPSAIYTVISEYLRTSFLEIQTADASQRALCFTIVKFIEAVLGIPALVPFVLFEGVTATPGAVWKPWQAWTIASGKLVE
jgi:hypothetical protein